MAAPKEKSFYVLEYHTSKSVVTAQQAFRAKYVKGIIKRSVFARICLVKSFVKTRMYKISRND
jgi:hypothetical protein